MVRYVDFVTPESRFRFPRKHAVGFNNHVLRPNRAKCGTKRGKFRGNRCRNKAQRVWIDDLGASVRAGQGLGAEGRERMQCYQLDELHVPRESDVRDAAVTRGRYIK